MARPQGLDVAIFRNDAGGVFALLDRCPHKGGPLSQGIVFGTHVACPLHNWTIGLCDGQASAPDEGCTPKFAVKVEDGAVYLDAADRIHHLRIPPAAVDDRLLAQLREFGVTRDHRDKIERLVFSPLQLCRAFIRRLATGLRLALA